MVSWKSRWSCVRLVNTAQSNSRPDTRSSDSECDDTSITTARGFSGAVRIMRKISAASGVVLCASCEAPAAMYLMVPNIHTLLSSRLFDRSDLNRWAVVVLPLVPVIAVMVTSDKSIPYTILLTMPRVFRVLSICAQGTGHHGWGFSDSTAHAPLSIALRMNPSPSTRKPGMLTNSAPGNTLRESPVTSAMAGFAYPPADFTASRVFSSLHVIHDRFSPHTAFSGCGFPFFPVPFRP